jgi:hypothetical protein
MKAGRLSAEAKTTKNSMKAKAIFLMAILLLKGTCGGEMTAEQVAAFDKEWERSKQLAILYYPDSDKKETPLRKKMVEMMMRLDDADDPLFNTPNHLFVLTVMAASELGIKPVKSFFSDANSELPTTVDPSDPQLPPSANGKAPKYVTPQQIKVYWYNQLPTPSTMDRDFYRAKEARENFVAAVKAGRYDLAAEKAAARFNKQEALKFGDNERATLCEAELARIAQQEADVANKRNQQKIEHRQQEIERKQREIEYEQQSAKFRENRQRFKDFADE